MVARMTMMLDMDLEEKGKRGWSQATKLERNGSQSSVETQSVMTLRHLSILNSLWVYHAIQAHQRLGNGFSGIAA